MKLQVELDEVQVQALLEALDFYSRFGSGQVSLAITKAFSKFRPRTWSHENAGAIRILADQLQARIAPTALNLRSDKVAPNVRTAFDLFQVIRQEDAKARLPNLPSEDRPGFKLTVAFDPIEPVHPSVPLARVRAEP